MERVDYDSLIVQDLINWKKHDELNLEPWYQRRSVWTGPQKSYLINTLFEQKPVPTLYFRHVVDLDLDKSLREVVDGQQRIRSILGYVDNDFAALHPEHGRRVTYSKLSRAQQRMLRETKLSGGWLLGATDEDVIEVFGRLNSVAKTLNSSEKRNAAFSGEFKQFCLKEASSRLALWRNLKVFSANAISRMEETEFLADVVLNFLEGLSDFRKNKIDGLYANNEEEFQNAAKIKQRLDACFSKVASLPATSITDTIFYRVPVFFSLIIVLDEIGASLSKRKLNSALLEIDRRFNSDKPVNERPATDAQFYEACRASTQRIKNRKVRHSYIMRFLK